MFPGAPGEVSYTQERIVSAGQIRRIHDYVRVRFPKLKESIVGSRYLYVCEDGLIHYCSLPRSSRYSACGVRVRR